ncbi:MAG TPA: hypothetical protein VF062_03610 [Candidatus Limnocylindrales bacterium]
MGTVGRVTGRYATLARHGFLSRYEVGGGPKTEARSNSFLALRLQLL